MTTLVKQRTRYHLQCYDPSRSPNRKRMALRSERKTTRGKLKTKLEHDYLLGTFDPWVDNPFSYGKERIRAPRPTGEALVRPHGRHTSHLRSHHWTEGK